MCGKDCYMDDEAGVRLHQEPCYMCDGLPVPEESCHLCSGTGVREVICQCEVEFKPLKKNYPIRLF